MTCSFSWGQQRKNNKWICWNGVLHQKNPDKALGRPYIQKHFWPIPDFKQCCVFESVLPMRADFFCAIFGTKKNLVPPRIPVSVRVPGEQQPFDARLFEATSSQLVLEQDWGSAQTSLNQVGSHQIGVHQVDPKNGRQEMLEIWLVDTKFENDGLSSFWLIRWAITQTSLIWAHSFTSRPCGTVGWNSGGDGAGGYTMLVLVLVF